MGLGGGGEGDGGGGLGGGGGGLGFGGLGLGGGGLGEAFHENEEKISRYISILQYLHDLM